MRSAGRSWRWRCVWRQSRHQSRRRQQGLATGQGGTPMRVMPPIMPDGTTVIIIITGTA
jgi:hypothetical protein